MKIAALIGMALACSAACGQTVIDPANKFAWGENIGWTNWADANGGASAAMLTTSFMEGFVWGENVGWINLGDGTPTNGVSYANVNGTDFGVNINTLTGALTGFAWGENIGWINFSGGALATPAQPARLDLSTNRLRGWVWGENVGWINLDDANKFVGVIPPAGCEGDLNQDGNVDQADVDCLISLIAGDPSCLELPTFDADFNRDGNADQGDVDAFISFVAGGPCP